MKKNKYKGGTFESNRCHRRMCTKPRRFAISSEQPFVRWCCLFWHSSVFIHTFLKNSLSVIKVNHTGDGASIIWSDLSYHRYSTIVSISLCSFYSFFSDFFPIVLQTRIFSCLLVTWRKVTQAWSLVFVILHLSDSFPGIQLVVRCSIAVPPGRCWLRSLSNSYNGVWYIKIFAWKTKVTAKWN